MRRCARRRGGACAGGVFWNSKPPTYYHSRECTYYLYVGIVRKLGQMDHVLAELSTTHTYRFVDIISYCHLKTQHVVKSRPRWYNSMFYDVNNSFYTSQSPALVPLPTIYLTKKVFGTWTRKLHIPIRWHRRFLRVWDLLLLPRLDAGPAVQKWLTSECKFSTDSARYPPRGKLSYFVFCSKHG